MSLGNVYHCSYEHSPWIILWGSLDPTGTARGDIYLIRIIDIIFGHTVRGVLENRFDFYPILHFDF